MTSILSASLSFPKWKFRGIILTWKMSWKPFCGCVFSIRTVAMGSLMGTELNRGKASVWKYVTSMGEKVGNLKVGNLLGKGSFAYLQS